eukprot:TRINITY_DN60398_c0_g1_i1.p1 TRINITY_DN60398_c0_g1~~TRINITY_DN60398_c0_g1_i1.p1  ORF type:complete len:175 (-),score=41.37 TRINITY_DN60398_c0_g1_i1:343-867(-)
MMALATKKFANQIFRVKNTFIQDAADEDDDLDGATCGEEKLLRQMSEPASFGRSLDDSLDGSGDDCCCVYSTTSTPSCADVHDASTTEASSFASVWSTEEKSEPRSVLSDTKAAPNDHADTKPQSASTADTKDGEIPRVCHGFVLTPVCWQCGNQVQSCFKFCVWCGSNLKAPW